MKLTALYRCTAVRPHHTAEGEDAQLLEFVLDEMTPDWVTTKKENIIFMVVKDRRKWDAIAVGEVAVVSMDPLVW